MSVFSIGTGPASALCAVVLLLPACSAEATSASTGPPTTVAPTTVAPTTEPVTPMPPSATVGGGVVPAPRPAPQGVDPTSACMLRAAFEDPARSEYLLPFPVGAAYRLNQSYCFAQGTHRDQPAYDFLMPVGSDVTASRAGTVVDLFDANPDNGSGHANYLIIEHEDGSAALYGHLQQDSLRVEHGQVVAAGEVIASSGRSGQASLPHLHFAVFSDWPNLPGGGIGVNFSNADGPLDFLGGLLRDGVFRALPPDDPPVAMPIHRPGVYAGFDLDGVDLEWAVLWSYDFTGAGLSGARLRGADLGHALLDHSVLTGADLSLADLRSARLRGAVLDRADLGGADLSLADLTGATLIGADLSGAQLPAAILTGADLTGARLDRATLIGVVYDPSTRWPAGFEPPPQP